MRTGAHIMGAPGGTFSFTVARAEGPRHTPVDLGPALEARPRSSHGERDRHLPPSSSSLSDATGISPGRDVPEPRPERGTARGRILVTPRSHPERYPGRPAQRDDPVGQRRAAVVFAAAQAARDLKTVSYRGQLHVRLLPVAPRGRSFYALIDRAIGSSSGSAPATATAINTHELQVTAAGTVYVSAYRPVRVCGTTAAGHRLRHPGDRPGNRRRALRVARLDHVPPVGELRVTEDGRGSWDYFHGNSIEPPPSRRGNILVSARNTSAVYGINRRTGAVRWTLGGKQDEFGLVKHHPGRQFCAQHDARRQPNGDITLFDNGGPALGNMSDCPVHEARVMRFRLDLRRRKAHLVRTIGSEPSSETGAGYFAWAMGNAQRLGDGAHWSAGAPAALLTRVTPGGHVSFGMQFERYTYRAVRSAWTGRPRGRPPSRRGATAAGQRPCGRAGTGPRRSATGACSPAAVRRRSAKSSVASASADWRPRCGSGPPRATSRSWP